MRSTQDKFLEILDKNLPKTVEVVRDMAYVNKGTLRIQPKDGFDTLVQVDYDFQQSTVSIWVKPSEALLGFGTVVGDQRQVVLDSASDRLGDVIGSIVSYVKDALGA